MPSVGGVSRPLPPGTLDNYCLPLRNPGGLVMPAPSKIESCGFGLLSATFVFYMFPGFGVESATFGFFRFFGSA